MADENPEKRTRVEKPLSLVKTFALENPPVPTKNFYIDIAADVDAIISKIKLTNTYLIRGPPAAGKTTVARAIRDHAPFSKRGSCGDISYVLIHGHRLVKGLEDDSSIASRLISLLNHDANLGGALSNNMTISDVLDWLASESVVLIADEAHFIFAKLYNSYIKDSDITALFFTTTPEMVGKNVDLRPLTPSPSGISKKFYWSGGLDEEQIVIALRQTKVKLKLEAIRALIQISGVHRGVLARLLDWVEEKQSNTAGPKVFLRQQHRRHQRHTHTRARVNRHNHYLHTRSHMPMSIPSVPRPPSPPPPPPPPPKRCR